MVKDLFTIKEAYAKYNIYIWDVSIPSMAIFGKLVLKGLNIKGFLSERTELCEQSIMNRRILGLQQIGKMEKALVIVPDSENIEAVQAKLKKSNLVVLHYTLSLEIDREIRNRKFLIYGTGEGCDRLEKELSLMGAEADGYILSKVNESVHNGKKVLSVEKATEVEKYLVIISTLNRKYIAEILNNLQEKGIEQIYVYADISCYWHLRASSTFTLIDYAYKTNKKILIYGEEDLLGSLMRDILYRYGINSVEFVREMELFDVMTDDISKYFIIIPDICEYQIDRKCNYLEKMGIGLSQYQYTGLGLVKRRLEKEKMLPDSMMGYAFENTFYGIEVLGNADAEFRVIVLGGSTSTIGYYRPVSWIEMLYKKLTKAMGDVVIYNMGFLGNDVVIEILKLLRDGFYLNPDYVISLSGVNNTYEKGETVNQFNVVESIKRLEMLGGGVICNGVDVKEELFDFWIRNQKIIKNISELYGAEYVGVLQPMNIGKKDKNLFETMYFEDSMYEKSRSFYERSRNDDFYINMINEFADQDGMYIDHCHYSETGNAVIAERIFQEILEREHKT